MDFTKIKQDFFTFSDPATDNFFEELSESCQVKIVRNGVDHHYSINKASGNIVARHENNKVYSGVASLFASSSFADIRKLADTQARIFKDFRLDALMPPEGMVENERMTLERIDTVISPLKDAGRIDKLRIVLIDGPAGVGKTFLVRRFLIQRARDYLAGKGLPPILHVNSNGKRLSNLQDALASAIQDLRANFTYDQVPILVRHDLLQIAIDGFDELVDPDGYRDAWYALRDFFEKTRIGGPIILSGRDTFFDEQKFQDYLKSFIQNSELLNIRLSTLEPSDAKKWLQNNALTLLSG